MRPLFRTAALSALLVITGLALTSCVAWIPRKKVGKLAPKLTIDSLYQAPRGARADWVALSGKVVVLHFWGTWQNESIESIPRINRLAREFANDPVVFIHVTDETDEARLAEFTQTLPIRGWIAIDQDRSLYNTYGIENLPTVWIVNAEGKLVAITYSKMVTADVIRAALDGRSEVPIKEGFHD